MSLLQITAGRCGRQLIVCHNRTADGNALQLSRQMGALRVIATAVAGDGAHVYGAREDMETAD
jgi:hypothetical protein